MFMKKLLDHKIIDKFLNLKAMKINMFNKETLAKTKTRFLVRKWMKKKCKKKDKKLIRN